MAEKRIRAKKEAIWLWILCLCVSSQIFGQNDHAHSSTWLMPTISFQCSDRVRFMIQGNWIPQENSTYVYAQGFFKVGKHVTLNSGYMHISVPPQEGLNRNQSTWVNGVILSFPLGSKFTLENRILAWNRFINNSKDQHLLLNRVKIVRAAKIASRKIQFYISDEVSFAFENTGWSRNRVGAGSSLEILPWASVDLFLARQNDSTGAKFNLTFVTLTFQIPPRRTVNKPI